MFPFVNVLTVDISSLTTRKMLPFRHLFFILQCVNLCVKLLIKDSFQRFIPKMYVIDIVKCH